MHLAGIVSICAAMMATPAFAQSEYQLSAGDTVELFVSPSMEEPLSVTIDNEGRVLVPLVGAVSFNGLTTTEAGEALKKSLQDAQVLADPVVAVSLSSPRPIFVTGDVTDPGSFPGRLGMRVDEAVAIAGGTRNKASTELSAGAIAELQADLVAVVAEIEALDIRQARYDAEAAGSAYAPEIDISQEPGTFVARLTQIERDAHVMADEQFARETRALEETLVVLAREQEAILAQQEALSQVVALFDEELNTANELEERGLGLRRQSVSNERNLFSARAELMDQRRRFAATEQEQIDIQLRIDDLGAKRREEALRQLSKIAVERVGLISQRDAITSRLGYSSIFTGADADAQSPLAAEGSVATQITRVRQLANGERVSEVVRDSDSVLPGDLIVVRILPNFRLLQ